MSQAMKLAKRNEELEKELRDIDHVALAVEADCNSAVKENNRRVCRLQVIITTNYIYCVCFQDKSFLISYSNASLGEVRRCHDTAACLGT